MVDDKQALVLVIKNEQPLEPEAWQCLWQPLSARLQQQALGFRRWEDRQASVLGKHLLVRGLHFLGYSPSLIYAMQWGPYKRPFLPSGPDFNISHTGGLVVCALHKEGRLGVDVEAKRAVNTEDYRSVFTPNEARLIAASPDPIACFYTFWTRKEAVMKADGRGFYLCPTRFEVIADEVEINDTQWHLKTVPLPDDFVCHLALEQEVSISLQFVTVNALVNSSRVSR